jgi:phenylacetate-CoA ligase
MIYDWKMELYWRLPIRVQEAALSLYARYLNRHYYTPDLYDSWRQQYQCWQTTWSKTTAEVWQNQQLQTLLELAATQVPYYRQAWHRIDWKSVKSAVDLHVLPLVDKQTIRQNESAFLVEGNNPKTLWVEKTSGTTGTALRIFWPKAMLPKWWALSEVMSRNVAGVGQDIPRAMMGGRPIVRGDTNLPPFWRYNRYWHQLYLSSYHVSHHNAPYYISAIRYYDSQWITGYGSAIATLAESAMEAGLESLKLRSALVSGDTLLPGMRSRIEQFFQCKCFDHYGQSEGVCTAMECHQGRMHLIPMAGILEILREDGSPCLPGEIGEMVATGLLNDVMPFIRYRLGDYAAWAEDQHCPCGNPYAILTHLVGRVDDYLITGDGRKIGRLSTAIKRSPTIHSAQLVQNKPGHAYLLIHPGDNYQSADARAVHDDILERIGSFNLTIMEVTEIPKTPQGKSVLVVRLADRPSMRETYQKLLGKQVF